MFVAFAVNDSAETLSLQRLIIKYQFLNISFKPAATGCGIGVTVGWSHIATLDEES
jgi:hypothetical protein